FSGWLLVLSLVAPSAAAYAEPAPTTSPTVHTTPAAPTAASPAANQAQGVQPLAATPAVGAAADRLIVTFNTNQADASTTSRAHAAVGATPLETHGRVDVVKVDPSQLSQAQAAYRQQPGVASVSVDRRASVTEVPSDPLYGTATSGGYPMGWSLDAIGAPSAWNVSHGDGIKVAVLDTGVLTSHEDLAGQVFASKDFSASASGATDVYGHGTHVAGIIAATENNGRGLVGVAPRAKLLNGKILGDDGTGYLSDEIAGIQWAVQQGARVINLSLGASGPCDPSEQAVIDDAWAAGVVLVAAAGNAGVSGALSPANCNHVIGIAASTPGGPSAPSLTEARASFSNYGPGVQLAAPGKNVYSTMLSSGTVSSQTGYGPLSGTSMATPQVAGVAALVWATRYGTSSESVASRLTGTADAIAGTGSAWTYGRVNAAAAVGAVMLAAPSRVDDGLSADLATQATTTQMSAHWPAVSGAAGYEYAIGTAPGLGDVVGWTDNSVALAMTQTGLSLSNGVTYYVSVRAYDAGAVRYAAASSNGVQVVVPAVAAPASVVDGAANGTSLGQL
ncbi:MAG TPA: S8 family serine peptidase, partial [Chloroflexota bacterium]